jgi:hypothetical protein
MALEATGHSADFRTTRVSVGCGPRLSLGVIAPRKAWRLWQGESPCRVRVSHPPVASLASMAEPGASIMGPAT